jgi:predicted  nucleic acid-binding Zn-ribbon protein
MSTTPRTDDAKEQYLTGKMGVYGVLDEARKLETELAAAKKRIADCEFVMAHRYDIIERQEPRCNEANARAEKAEAELAKAKATIEDICTGGRLTCDQCLETMPCNCGHSLRRL